MNCLLFLTFSLLIMACNSTPNNFSRDKLEMQAYKAYKLTDYRSSINYYNQLIKEDRLNGSYYFGRGSSYMMFLKTDEAIKDFLESAQLNYRTGSCYFNLGLLNTFFNDSVALNYFKAALKIYPNRDDIQKEYDECLERLKTNSSH